MPGDSNSVTFSSPFWGHDSEGKGHFPSAKLDLPEMYHPLKKGAASPFLKVPQKKWTSYTPPHWDVTYEKEPFQKEFNFLFPAFFRRHLSFQACKNVYLFSQVQWKWIAGGFQPHLHRKKNGYRSSKHLVLGSWRNMLVQSRFFTQKHIIPLTSSRQRNHISELIGSMPSFFVKMAAFLLDNKPLLGPAKTSQNTLRGDRESW